MTRHISQTAKSSVESDLLQRINYQLSGEMAYCNGSWWRNTRTAWEPQRDPRKLWQYVTNAIQEAAANHFDWDAYQVVAGSYLTQTNLPKLIRMLQTGPLSVSTLVFRELPTTQPVSLPGPESVPSQPR